MILVGQFLTKIFPGRRMIRSGRGRSTSSKFLCMEVMEIESVRDGVDEIICHKDQSEVVDQLFIISFRM